MKQLGWGALLLSLVLPIHAAASDAPATYAQFLVDRLALLHPHFSAIALRGKPAGKTAEIILASRGHDSATAEVIERVKTSGATVHRTVDRGRNFEVDLPLLDASRRPVGVLSLDYAVKGHVKTDAMVHEAVEARDALARRISHVANLSEPAQFDPNILLNSYAQSLVDRELDARSDVVILAIHAATPRNTDPSIIASNIGRIGKKADEDDLRVVNTGATNKEVNESGDRFEAELPLRDVSGDRIGAVGVVFNYKTGDDKEGLVARATAIRDDLARRISNPANLVEPYPYDSRYSDRTVAEGIVEHTLAAHPDILILAFHVTPPGRAENVIIASNIGRIGKKADDDDMRVVTTGKPNLEVNEKGNRFELESALHDAKGESIGAISVVYAYKMGDDKEALHRKADAVGDEIARQIPSLAALCARAP